MSFTTSRLSNGQDLPHVLSGNFCLVAKCQEQDEEVHDDGVVVQQEFLRSPPKNPATPPSSPSEVTWLQCIYAGCAALNSCNLGYDLGVTTSAMMLLQRSMDLTDEQVEIFVGSMSLASMVGSLGAHLVSDSRLGRRGTFAISAVLFVTGVIIMSLSTTFVTLILGRVIVGVAIGVGLAIDPIYISEISPPEHRGQLVTWSEIAINVGVILAFGAGLVLSRSPDDMAWRCMIGFGAILPMCMLALTMTVMPESPRWLVQRGKEDEARTILRGIYPYGCDIELVVKGIKDSLREEAEAARVGWKSIIFPSGPRKRMLIVGLVAAISQALGGISAVGGYQAYIIADSGIQGKTSQALCLFGLGVIKLFTVIAAAPLIDKIGRRPLFLISLVGMAVALLFLAGNSFRVEWLNGEKDNFSEQFAIFSIGLYMTFFSVGAGPLAWLIPSEVFSLTIRAKAMSLATFLNRLTATVMSSTFLSLEKAITWGGCFMLLSLNCVLVAVSLYFILPETKGKSLEGMQAYFEEVACNRSILAVTGNLHNYHRNELCSETEMVSKGGALAEDTEAETESNGSEMCEEA